MSKTKKYKYFRKNRRGKNGKNSKHKTRRVQRGGEGDKKPASLHSHDSHPPLPTLPSGKSAAAAAAATPASLHSPGSHPPQPKPPSQQQAAATQAPNQPHAQQAAQQQPTQASNQPHTEQQPTHQPPDTGVGLNPPADMGSNKGPPADPLGASHGAIPDEHNTKAESVSAVAQQAVVPTGALPETYGNPNFNTSPYMGPMENGLGYPPQIAYQPSVVPADTVTKGTSTSIKPDPNPNSEEKNALWSIIANENNKKKEVPMSPDARTIYERFMTKLKAFTPGDEKSIRDDLRAQDVSKLAEINPMVNAAFEIEIKNAIFLHKIINDDLGLLTLELEKINQTIKQNINNEEKTEKLKIKKDSIKAEIAKVTSEMNALITVIDSIRTTMGAEGYVNPLAPVNYPSNGSASTGPTSEEKPGFISKVKGFFTGKNENENKYKKLDDESGDTNKKKGFVSKVKGFFTRKNKVAPEHTPETTPPETTPPGETPPEGTHAEVTQAKTPEQEYITQQDELFKKHGLTRRPGGLTRFTQGVAKKYNNAKKTLKRGFTDLKQKFSKDTTGENKRLLDDTEAQKKTWKEKFTFKNMKKSASEGVNSLRTNAKNLKDAVVKRITRKNKGSTEENTEENTRLLIPKGSDVEMQTVQSQQLEQPEAPKKPPPPRPTPSPESVSLKASEPSSDSKLSQQSMVDLSVQNKESDTFNLPTKITQPLAIRVPPSVSPRQRQQQQQQQLQLEARAVQTAQAAGGKTRKNRQYIHEIKENRTHLFNKEMQILNSIRNFKNGQHHGPNERGKNKPENIQKKFIKVIKRS
jgi:hypothetical protein